MKTYPLSSSQLGIFVYCLKNPGSLQYNLPAVVPLLPSVDLDRLEASLQAVVKCRDVMRIRFTVGDDGEPRQYVDEEMIVPVVRLVTDDSNWCNSLIQPFDILSGAPLVRIHLVSFGGHSYLHFDFHHLICDGWSYCHSFLGVDLPRAYAGLPFEEHACGMFRQALYEEEQKASPSYQMAKEYFLSKFSDFPFLSLTSCSKSDSRGPLLRHSLLVGRSAVDSWCSLHAVTPNLLFMASFAVVMARLGRAEAFAFYTMHHGRSDRRLANDIGMFVRSYPLLAQVGVGQTFDKLIRSLRQEMRSAVRHGAYPFAHLCRDLNRVPGVYFNFLAFGDMRECLVLDHDTMPGYQPSRSVVDDNLGCEIYLTSEGNYELRCQSSGALYDMAFLQNVARSLTHVIRQATSSDPMRLLCDKISLVDEEEESLLVKLSSGEQTSPSETPFQSVPSLIQKQVYNSPESLALTDGTYQLSYRKLNQLVNKYARCLLALGVGKGDVVGVLLPHRVEYIVSAIAVMQCGAVYMPLSTDYPSERILRIAEDSSCKIIFTSKTCPTDPIVSTFERLLFVEQFDDSTLEDVPVILPEVAESDPAYIIYTSGSTGTPKGVVVPHRALSNLVRFLVRQWRISSASRICCHSDFAFDASIEDMFPALTVGGSVHVPSDEIRHDVTLMQFFIIRQRITGGCYSTLFGLSLLEQYPDLPVDYVVLGGERMTHCPECRPRVINTYGPTEFTVDATYFELDKGVSYESIPIGRPLDNQYAFVLDATLHPVSQGMIGELCLAGSQMALGYHNRAVLTEQKFVRVVLAGKSYSVYRTGDLVYYDADGNLHFVGRQDGLVKWHGYRIELSEIEQALLSFSSIREACVVVSDTTGSPHLCAYFTSSESIDLKVLREQLSHTMPTYMIPTHYRRLERMPVTHSGKIDRTQLPDDCETLCSDYVAPSTSIQRSFCEIFAHVCGTEHVGIDDDFFLIGGTSINAITVVVEARKIGIELVYNDIFQQKTPRRLADYVENGATSSSQTIPPPEMVISQGRIVELLRENTYENCKRGVCQPMNDVLLTGVTGFLGAHVLYELLTRTSCSVRCVVRQKDDDAIETRVLDVMMYYFGHQFQLSQYAGRVTFYCCDVCDESSVLSLREELPRELTVINCAACVKHFSPNDEIWKVNTQSVRNLIRLCLLTQSRLVHISTMSVAGFSCGRSSTFTECDFVEEQYVGINSYVRSKWESERLVLEAVRESGLNALILRVGNLSPRRSDGRFQRNYSANNMMGSMRAIFRLGVVPSNRLSQAFDISPIDDVAHAIVLLCTVPKSCFVLHPFNPHPFTMSELVSTLNTLGHVIRVVSPEEYAEILNTRMAGSSEDAQYLRPLVSYETSSSESYSANICDSTLTAQILHAMHFDWARPNADYMQHIVSLCKDWTE